MADGDFAPLKTPRFKPTNGARRRDYRVERLPHAEAAEFVRQHHYAKGCANTSSESFGLFRGPFLVGAAVWMPPTKVCAMTIDPVEWRRVLSLSRLAVAPPEPQNAASLFIGDMMRTLNSEQRWTAAVTFADESQGHEGTIYKATNWRYLNRTAPEPRWEDANGKQVSRLSTKSRTAAGMRALGHRMVGKYRKHKFAKLFDIGLAQALIRWGMAMQAAQHKSASHE
jgi:hypothetical protein